MSWWLAPASSAYGAAVAARGWWYRSGMGRVRSLGRPVISIGNLSVGGTGKTPLVILLGEAFLARGIGVTVLSRGYRGAAERRGGLVADGRGAALMTWVDAGDEPALIARRLPRAAVIVGRDRAAAWARVADRLPPGVCLLDDGFQHLSLARDENLVLLDATEPYEGASLLPRGRLREPVDALARASTVVLTRVDQAPAGAVVALECLVRTRVPDRPVFHARFEPSDLEEIGTGRRESLASLAGARVLAAAAIGRFESFVTVLERSGASVAATIRYRDHHPYTRSDVGAILRRARELGARVVTTEKDAVKLESRLDAGESVWALRLETHIAEASRWEALIDRLAASVRP